MDFIHGAKLLKLLKEIDQYFSQDAPLETSIDIDGSGKPDPGKPESGTTVITRSPCPYSGGNPELAGARFDPTADEDYAIRFESAYKHYGHGRTRTPVLLGLDMNVERGQIYGLLGKVFL